MGKIVKGILLGAAVGAGIRVAQDLRSEDDLGAIAPRVAKTAGEAALAGASVGILLTMRDRRRSRRLAKQTGVAKLRSLAETSLQVAVPALQQAAEITRERAAHAAEAAKPHVEHAVDTARERASNVADLAAEKAKRRLADLDLPTAVIAV